ncbi:MAG: sodium:solute symporter family protein [Gammaproteobacteria bacterium]
MHADVAIVIGVYFLGLLGWNLRNFLKARSSSAAEEVAYVGHRNFGAGALIATLVAVYASNYTLLAAAESGFKYGLSGPIWYALGVALPLVFFIWPVNLISRMRASMPRGVTLVEYYGVRYDERTRLAALIVVLIASIIGVVSVVVAIGIVLDSLLNIGTTASILVGGGVLILYTALGGYEGTARSHVFQLMIAGLAVAVSLVIAFYRVDLPGFVHQLGAGQRDLLAWGPTKMLDFFLALAALAIANPVLWQRMFSARDDKSATRAMGVFPWLWVPFALGSGLMGMIAFKLMPAIAPDQAATRLVVHLFPAWAAVLFLLGGLALVFSSGDAAINNIASIVQFDVIDRYFHRHFQNRRGVYLSFGLQIVLGLIGIAGALGVKSILHLLIVNSAVNIALLVPLVLGLVWKRARASAAFWAIVAALLVGAGLMAAGFGAIGDLVALVVSAVLMMALSVWFPGRGEPAVGAQSPAKHAAAGVAFAVALYTVLFALASAFGGVKFVLPGFIFYPLMAYAFGGCLLLALVLPMISLRRGGNRTDSDHDARGDS